MFLVIALSVVQMNSTKLFLTKQENQIQNQTKRELQSTLTCPKVDLNESYAVTYGQNLSITPKFNLNCNGTFTIISGRVQSNDAFSFVTNNLVLSNWAVLQDNRFYELTAEFIVQNPSQVQYTITDKFFLVVGTVNIFYVPLGTGNAYSFDQPFLLDYSSAIDPLYPETGTLSYVWTCPANYVGCSNLGKSNMFEPVTRISVQKFAFDIQYTFTVNITNTKYPKRTIIDTVSFIIPSPISAVPKQSCVDFTMNVTNAAQLSLITVSANELLVNVNSLSPVDIKIGTPAVSVGKCPDQSYKTLSFVSYNNRMLFSDIRSYVFNTTVITISKAQQQNAFTATVKKQQFTAYTYLVSSATNQVMGYSYVTMTLSLVDNSLYAVPLESYIEIDSDKILYLDGRNSYDARDTSNSDYNYTWACNAKSSIVLPKTERITIYPENRTSWGVNSPGYYSSYSLVIQDSTRKSSAAPITILVTPVPDPNKCLKVTSSDVNNGATMTVSTFYPKQQYLIWSTKSNPTQFWTLGDSNRTVIFSADTLKNLAKSKPFTMVATVRYLLGTLLYQATFSFNLVVQREYMFVLVNYPDVVNPKEANIKLDATPSYSTYDQYKTNTPTKSCIWTCSALMDPICKQATMSDNNCIMSLSSIVLMQHANYRSMLNVAQAFTVQVTKGTLVNQTTVNVIITENKADVGCKITTYTEFSPNQYALLGLQCPTTMNITSYKWSVISATGANLTSSLSPLNTRQSQFHIPPYQLSQQKYVLIQCQILISSGAVQTYQIEKDVNSYDQFSIGKVNINFNQVTAYLTNFITTPTTLQSYLTNVVYFQIRVRESITTVAPRFRILFSQYISDSSNPLMINLPPITYENAIYYDTLDQEGNYQTIKQPMISTTDIKINANTMNNRMNAIMTSMTYKFNETETIWENAVFYMYNYIYIDKALNQIQSPDRVIIIKQNVIETFYYLTKKVKDVRYRTEILNILGLVVKDQFYFGDLMLDTSMKLMLTFQQMSDISYTSQFDSILVSMYKSINSVLYSGETMKYSLDEYTLTLTQLSANYTDLPSFKQFAYSKTTMQNRGGVNSMMALLQNKTFVYLQLLDSSMSYITVQGLSTTQLVNVSFFLTYDQSRAYQGGQLGFSCAIRDSLQTQWSNTTQKMKFIQYSPFNGQVVCQANQLSMYRLQFKGSYTETGTQWPGSNPDPNNDDEEVPTDTGNNNNTNTNTTTNTTNPPTNTTNNQTNTTNPPTNTTNNQTNTTNPPTNTTNNQTNTTNPPTNTTNNQTNTTNPPTNTTNNQTNTTTPPTNTTNTTKPNNTQDQDQDGGSTGGKWNETLGNQTNLNINLTYVQFEPLLFDQKSPLMTTLSLLTLVFFILMNLAFCIRYKNEHQTQNYGDDGFEGAISQKFQYKPQFSLGMNRYYMFKELMIQFNPYLNMFKVYNKFLSRWIRSAITQLYFMTIALIYGINAAMLTYDLSAIGKDKPIQLIGIFFIGVVIVILIRPWSLLFFYKLLYEPTSRVQHLALQRQNSMGNSKAPLKSNDIEVFGDMIEKEHKHQFSRQSSGTKQQPQELMMILGGPTPGEDEENNLEDIVRKRSQTQLVLPEIERKDTLINNENSQITLKKEPKIKKLVKKTVKKQAGSNPGGFTLPSFKKKKAVIIKQEIMESPTNSIKNSDSSKSIIHQDNPQAEEQYVYSPKLKTVKKQIDQQLFNDSLKQSSGEVKLPKLFNKGGIYANQNPIVQNSDQKITADRLQDDINIQPVEDDDEQHQEEANQPQVNYFEEFNMLVDGFGENNEFYEDQGQDQIYEGGSEDEEELDRVINGDNQFIQHSFNQEKQGPFGRSPGLDNYPTYSNYKDPIDTPANNPMMSRNTTYQNKNSTDQVNSLKKQDSITSTELDFEENLDDMKLHIGQTIFVNKILGKILLLVIWTALVVANIFCLKNMNEESFLQWLVLSILTYLIFQLVVDPILYWILACCMLQNSRINYFTLPSQRKNWREHFIVIFIGKAKMKDLTRRLNPPQLVQKNNQSNKNE
eukprot:403357907